MILPIVTNIKMLKRSTEFVSKDDIKIYKPFIDNMLETLNSFPFGVGLASTQVWQDKNWAPRIFVIKPNLVYVNPTIVYRTGKVIIAEESCLSFPGISVKKARHEKIYMRYLALDGEKFIEAVGDMARIMQHEIDHLDGVTIVK